MSKWFGAIFFLVLIGCTSRTRWVTFQVDSAPQGGQIEVNGVTLGSTPNTINLNMSERFTGLLRGAEFEPTGLEEYNITVYPPMNSSGGLFAQTKVIRPSTSPSGGKLFFDLRLDKVEPVDRIDLTVKNR